MNKLVKLLLVLFSVTTLQVYAETIQRTSPEFTSHELYAAKRKRKRRRKKRRRKRKKPMQDSMMQESQQFKTFSVKGVAGIVLGIENSSGISFGVGGDFVYNLNPNINFKAGVLYGSLSQASLNSAGVEEGTLTSTALAFGAGAYYKFKLMPNLEIDAGVRIGQLSVTSPAIPDSGIEEVSSSAIFAFIEPAVNYYFGDIYVSAELRYPIGITTAEEGDPENADMATLEKFDGFFIMGGVGYRF